MAMIDVTIVKVHRAEQGAKGGHSVRRQRTSSQKLKGQRPTLDGRIVTPKSSAVTDETKKVSMVCEVTKAPSRGEGRALHRGLLQRNPTRHSLPMSIKTNLTGFGLQKRSMADLGHKIQRRSILALPVGVTCLNILWKFAPEQILDAGFQANEWRDRG